MEAEISKLMADMTLRCSVIRRVECNGNTERTAVNAGIIKFGHS